MANPPTGIWEFDRGGRRAWMEFRKDGTARRVGDGREVTVRWRLSGDVIEILAEGSAVDKLTILRQRPEEMRLESHGMTLRFRRVEAIPSVPHKAPKIYQLISTGGVCRVNGIPLLESAGSRMINPFLIGHGNVLELEGNGRAEIPGAAVADTSHPRTAFEADVAPLRTLLEKVERVTEAEALAFADVLMGKLDSNHFEAKIDVYAEAMSGDAARLADELHDFLEGCFLKPGFEKVKRGEMQARGYCESRIWNIRQTNGDPLLQAHPDPDGGIATLDVFVAKVGGRMQVAL